MRIIVLRDMRFNDATTSSAAIRLQHDDCLSLLTEDQRSWIVQHGIEVCSNSHKDVVYNCFNVVLYALVEDSLATYYMLKWGRTQTERIYT